MCSVCTVSRSPFVPLLHALVYLLTILPSLTAIMIQSAATLHIISICDNFPLARRTSHFCDQLALQQRFPIFPFRPAWIATSLVVLAERRLSGKARAAHSSRRWQQLFFYSRRFIISSVTHLQYN
jgi:hypothetical protein